MASKKQLYIGANASSAVKTKALAEVTAAKPQIDYEVEQPNSNIVTRGLSLPHALIETSSGYHDIDGIYINNINVDAGLQKRGIGKRLTRSLCALALSEGVNVLHADVTNPHSLQMVRSIVEEDRITFTQLIGNVDTEIPLTVDQAVQSLERALSLADACEAVGLERVDVGLFVTINIAGVQGEIPIHR